MTSKTILTIAAVLTLGMGVTLYQIHMQPDTFTVVSPPKEVSQTQIAPPLPASKKVLVHIAGAVARPGLYEIEEGTRVHSIFDVAGGLLPQANVHKINMAAKVRDGKRYFVPTTKSPKPSRASLSRHTKAPASGSKASVHFPLHINSASQYELEQLPGIGKATAQAIITLRHDRGGFSQLNDLLEVRGIGPATLRKLSPYLSI